MGPIMKHPSGLAEDMLAHVSMNFWMLPDNQSLSRDERGTWLHPGVWERLLAFQQGYANCMAENKEAIDEAESRLQNSS